MDTLLGNVLILLLVDLKNFCNFAANFGDAGGHLKGIE
jgi:hypothetical protein